MCFCFVMVLIFCRCRCFPMDSQTSSELNGGMLTLDGGHTWDMLNSGPLPGQLPLGLVPRERERERETERQRERERDRDRERKRENM
jgi:hypothetical protein